MKHFLYILFIAILTISCSQNSEKPQVKEWALIIHGGAGNIKKENLKPEAQKKYENSLNRALSIGSEILRTGGTALDAVTATITYLESDPLFNAGKGAVFTHEKTIELDASIMNGRDLNAGAVAGIKTVKHPILAAKAVMEKSRHVLLAGRGAEEFAREQGLEMVPNNYFFTEKRLRQIEKILSREKNKDIEKHGTVGVVALDKAGNIAAGTSTGGLTDKRFGRIGDSPIIGAGTYADNSTCGVSCTGTGEYFIRLNIAHSISDLMRYKNYSAQKAADEMIHNRLEALGGDGGVICLDKFGNPAFSFNTAGMFRAYQNALGEKWVNMFGLGDKAGK